MKPIWKYKDKPYSILYESQIKIKGKWLPCIVYKCLYNNPDGMVWVRERTEFYKLFSIALKQ